MHRFWKFKELDNTKKAVATIIGGLIASLILPWLFTQRNFGIFNFSDTGQVGDTIGGIAGPILNFSGLLIVYFSLKEQFIANQEQRKSLKKESRYARRESSFNTALRLVDETKSYWHEHREGIKMLLDEEDKLAMSPPNTFIHTISEADDSGFFWKHNQDLKFAFNFFEAFLQSCSILSIQQQKIIISLFEAAYFKPLNQMESFEYNERSAATENYEYNYNIMPYYSPAREEITHQIEKFSLAKKQIERHQIKQRT